MKIQISALVLFLLCLSVRISGQKASITFRSDENISIRINKPIDNTSNLYFVTDKLDLKPNISISYELDVSGFCSVKCGFSDGRSRYFLLQEGDKLAVDYINKDILINGDNAEGNFYLYYNYVQKGLGSHYNKIDSIFKKYVTESIDFVSIDRDLREKVESPYLKDLVKMKKDGKITTKFADIMSQNLHYAYSDLYFLAYENLLRGRINGYKPTVSDSIMIMKRADQLHTPNRINDNPLKYYFGVSFADYYILKYKTLDAEAKNKLIDNYDKDTFGPCVAFLMAPDYMQPILMGRAFVEQLQNMQFHFNHDKMLKYLTEKFPNSEYLPIIRELMKNQNKKSAVSDEAEAPVVIDGKTINTLKELVQVEGIKGQYVYIDLWSTWCMPCKMQFQYNKDLHKLLSQYEKLVPVFISIDKDENEAVWKNQIEYYHLSGVNLRASAALYKEISEKIYGGQSCSIPRYILLDSEGNIMNDNLPRPQAINKLKEVLDKQL